MTEILENLDGRPVVIGAGLAGLMAALHLAPEPVIVLAKAPLGTGAASVWAQGGVAAALGDDDGSALHAADTLSAGDGLSDPQIVARITAAARAAIEELLRHGVKFDRSAEGHLRLGLEAAHARHRIVHADGDGTGREIIRALIKAVRQTPSITVIENVEARGLNIRDGRVAGVLAAGHKGGFSLATARVVIATGGLGGLYRHTTNPKEAIGQGLALAARAGAALADMEFVQFHPTALDVGLDPMPLVSEAVRGAGATLIDETGARFLAGQEGAELGPRDVVARAVWRHLETGHRVFLDTRSALGAGLTERYPTLAANCRAAGIDPVAQPIPVRPAAHYAMGGIAVDAAGRSTLAGLWACGEAAATGLHGANRLASNSLLEAAACARWVAESISGTPAMVARPLWNTETVPRPDATSVRQLVSDRLGVLRNRAGLETAIAALWPLAFGKGPAADPALVGFMIAVAACLRAESRGSHSRSDFPKHSPTWARRQTLRLDQAVALADNLMAEPVTHAFGT